MTDEVRITRSEYFRGDDRLYYGHLKGANGEIVASTEGYVDLADCKAALRSLAPDIDPRETIGE